STKISFSNSLGSIPGEYWLKSLTPISVSTSSHNTALPAYCVRSEVSTAWAESEYTSGVRERSYISEPPKAYCTAAVWMVVLGHKHVAGISYWAPIPSAAKDMLYFAIMYAGATPSHCWLRFRAGDRLKMRGSADFCRCGTAVRVKRNVPRTLISCMRS